MSKLDHDRSLMQVTSTPWVAIPVRDPETGAPGYEAVRYDHFVETLLKKQDYPLMHAHAAMGVCEEAGEISDQIKKNIIYGQDINTMALTKELGDLLFYAQAVMNLYGIQWNEVLQTNALKLSERYKGLQYSDEQAKARNDEKPIAGPASGSDSSAG